MDIAIACADIKVGHYEGGIAVYTRMLAEGLAKRGHRVTILGHGAQLMEEAWSESLKVAYIPNTRVWTPHPKLSSITKRLARSEGLRAYLEESQNYDVVEFPIWDAEGLHSLRLKSFKSVVRGHTPRAIVNELTKGSGQAVSRMDRLAAMLEARTARMADLYLANSQASLKESVIRFSLNPSRAKACLHGVVVPENVVEVSTHPVRILFVGRFETRKGIFEILKAIPRILERCPEVKFEFVGQLQPTDLASASAAANGSPLSQVHSQSITLHGKMDDASLDRLRGQCQLALLPSLYESFGLVHAEAMAHGMPVVAFDIGATKELIPSDEFGILVPAGDVPALASAVCKLVESPDLRVRIGRAARERVKSHISVEAMAACVERAYLTLLEGV